MRIVSLVPSATEIVCAIGAHADLVGRSHECDWPQSVLTVPVVTGVRADAATPRAGKPAHADSPEAIDARVRETLQKGLPLYSLDTRRLQELRPDLIITQDLCHVCSIDLESVRRIAGSLDPIPQVLSLNPTTVEGVLDDVLTVGEAIGREAAAREAVTRLRERFYAATDFVNPFDDGPSVTVLDWTEPLFVAGHWTPQLVERAGARHPLNATVPVPHAGAAAGPIGATQRAAGKSVAVPPEVLAATRPEFLVVAPCGRTLAQARQDAQALAAHPWWRDLPAVRKGQVALVDGVHHFSRPGPRLADDFEFLVGWLNHRPELIPADYRWARL